MVFYSFYSIFHWIKFKEVISILKAFRLHSEWQRAATETKQNKKSIVSSEYIGRVHFTWRNKVNRNSQIKDLNRIATNQLNRISYDCVCVWVGTGQKEPEGAHVTFSHLMRWIISRILSTVSGRWGKADIDNVFKSYTTDTQSRAQNQGNQSNDKIEMMTTTTTTTTTVQKFKWLLIFAH